MPPLVIPCGVPAQAIHNVDDATSLGHLRAWGCGLRSLQEPWTDTTTPIGEAMFHITIAWAGLDKQTLSERTRAAAYVP